MAFTSLLVIFLCLPKLYFCEGNSGSCSSNYMKLTAYHTMCKDPNPRCMILKRGVDEENKRLILKMHNTFRSKVATGNEGLGGGLPPAVDMLEMTWDDELAIIAQKHAETCIYEHDCDKCREVGHFAVGQNIGIKKLHLMPVQEENRWDWLINLLYAEVAWFPKNVINSYIESSHDPKTQYGHFTQIIWANSWRVGCGWVLFQEESFNSSYYVCNYGPSGNIINEKVYTEGTACSMCPRNACCGETCAQFNIAADYPGLCKVINNNLPPDGFGPHDADDYFFCEFNNEDDCLVILSGKNDWKAFKTIGGNWIGIILNGGQTAELMMTRNFISHNPRFCLKVVLRTGPQVEGDPYYLKGIITLLNVNGTSVSFSIMGTEYRTQFIPYYMDATMPQDVAMKVKLEFSVASGVPLQYLDIKQISARAGPCPLTTVG